MFAKACPILKRFFPTLFTFRSPATDEESGVLGLTCFSISVVFWLTPVGVSLFILANVLVFHIPS